MLKRLLSIVVLLLPLATVSFAETLPLPDNLTSAASPAGEGYFLEAEARAAYFSLADNFVTQKSQAFCDVASTVMVLNALQLPAPAVPEYDPYRTFTQDNVFTPATEAIIPAETIAKMGMTLDQLGGFIGTHPVTAEVHHAADSTLDSFRSSASDYLSKPGHFVVVNYLRKAIGQEKGGHISPLAAYDAKSDRFLILDVARYKYPPVWGTVADLFAAMNTIDSDNENRTRGYILIAAK
jgi:hypothetical protein